MLHTLLRSAVQGTVLSSPLFQWAATRFSHGTVPTHTPQLCYIDTADTPERTISQGAQQHPPTWCRALCPQKCILFFPLQKAERGYHSWTTPSPNSMLASASQCFRSTSVLSLQKSSLVSLWGHKLQRCITNPSQIQAPSKQEFNAVAHIWSTSHLSWEHCPFKDMLLEAFAPA